MQQIVRIYRCTRLYCDTLCIVQCHAENVTIRVVYAKKVEVVIAKTLNTFKNLLIDFWKNNTLKLTKQPIKLSAVALMPQSQMMQASYGSTVYGFQTGFRKSYGFAAYVFTNCKVSVQHFMNIIMSKWRRDRRATSWRLQDYRKLTVRF